MPFAMNLRSVVDAFPTAWVSKRGEHQLAQLGAGDPPQCLVHVDQALVDQLDRDPEGRAGRALADAGLQHPQLATLDRELDVAQVAVMLLERLHDRHQLVVAALVDALEIGQGHGVADAGHDVLALRVLQVIAVHTLLAAGGVAGEGDAGAGVGIEVAEHHRAHAHRGTQIAGDALLPAIDHGPLRVPRVEHRADGEIHLFAGFLRERSTRVFDDDVLERLDELAQVVGVQVEVGLGVLLGLRGVQRRGEVLGVDAQHRVAEHLDEPAVGVEGETLVAGLTGQPAHRLVVEPDVQDGVHHAGHRELRTGADGHQQRVIGLPQPLAHRVLEGGQVLGDLFAQIVGRVATLEVGATRFGGDRETGRDGQFEIGHLGEVRALAPEQVLHVPAAFSKVVDIFGKARHNGLPSLPNGYEASLGCESVLHSSATETSFQLTTVH